MRGVLLIVILALFAVACTDDTLPAEDTPTLIYNYSFSWMHGERAYLRLWDNRYVEYYYGFNRGNDKYVCTRLSQEQFDSYMRELQSFYDAGGDPAFGEGSSVYTGPTARSSFLLSNTTVEGPWPPHTASYRTHPREFFSFLVNASRLQNEDGGRSSPCEAWLPSQQ